MSREIVQFVRAKDFKFIKEIGQGGLGKTVLLRDDIINEEFVCKKYSPLYEEIKQEYFRNFVEEIRLLHLLNHRNIVRVFNYYLYPEKLTGYILMEFVDGQEIDSYIKDNPEKINDVFLQTILGFKYLENLKILHRDIRPQNILISNEGIVKIIDFGFGKKINFEDNFDKSISLNWRFSAPLEFDEETYDFRTEVYFVGKLFEELIKENKIESFSYNEVLLKMIKPDNQNRTKSFFEVLRKIEGISNIEFEFSQEEIEVYRSFAEGLSNIISKLYFESEYSDDIDLIVSKLHEIHMNSLLEESIQNNNKLIQCFIAGNFKYKVKRDFSTSILGKFISMFNGQSNEKKKIILNHLWNRFDAIEREEVFLPSDDLPF